MQSLIFLIAFFVFLYIIYKLVKDDYVFIRKGIFPEQTVDVTFFVIFVGVILARLFSLVFQPRIDKNIFLSFFSASVGELSLFGFVLGALLVLYYMGKRRKIALGRFFDFFTLAFLPSLAVWYFLSAIFAKGNELMIMLSYGISYSILTINFFRYLKPQLLSRSLKEGNITLFFLMMFSLLSLIETLFLQKIGEINLLHIGNLFALLLFLGSIGLYFKQEGVKKRS